MLGFCVAVMDNKGFGGNKKREDANFSNSSLEVRAKGLEPPRLSAPDPKSGAAANYATPAKFTFIHNLTYRWANCLAISTLTCANILFN